MDFEESGSSLVEPHTPTPRRAAPPISANALRRLLAAILRLAVALGSVPVYIRLVGVSQWGLLALFQAAAAPFSLLGLGLVPATIRQVAEYVGKGDDDSAAVTIRMSFVAFAAALLTGALILLALSSWFAQSLFEVPEPAMASAVRGFRFVPIFWIASFSVYFVTGLFAAFQRYDDILRLTLSSALVSTAFGLLAAYLTRESAWLLLAQATGLIVSILFMTGPLRAVLAPLRHRQGSSRHEFRRMLQFGRWFSLSEVGATLANWGDRYVLGVLFSPQMVGFYSLARQIQQMISSIFVESADVLLPAVAHRAGMEEIPEARRLSLLGGWLLTTVFGPLAVTVAVLGGDFLQLWISPAASDAATGTLRVLCVASLFLLAPVAPVTYALGVGKSQWQVPFSLTIGLISVTAGWFLAPSFHLLGVGLGLLAGAAIRWILFVPLWRSLFRPTIRSLEFVSCTCAPALTSLGALGLLVHLHDSFAHSPTWLSLFIEAFIAVASAGAMQLLIGEILPGGRRRRRDVLQSLSPLLPSFDSFALLRRKPRS